jgi:hypothetical protein
MEQPPSFYRLPLTPSSLSQAFASGGLLPGLVTVCWCGTTAAFGLYLLSRSAAEAPHRSASFAALSKLTFPRLGKLFDLAIFLKCYGVSISYLCVSITQTSLSNLTVGVGSSWEPSSPASSSPSPPMQTTGYWTDASGSLPPCPFSLPSPSFDALTPSNG